MDQVRVRTVPGWPGYCVSPCGAVFGPRKRLRPIDQDGYKKVRLYRKGKFRWFLIHLLVVDAFGPDKPSPDHEVDHKNGDRSDNRLDNLEWVTPQENCIRRNRRLGGNPKARKGHLPCSACGTRPRRLIKGRTDSYCRECHSSKESARYNVGRLLA